MSDTAKCWTGASIYCPTCKGPTKSMEEEYGDLSDGGSYERFKCLNANCKQTTIYVELPD